MKTTIFLRKKRNGENSMEMLLQSLLPYFHDVRVLELPEYSTSLKGIFRNILFVRRNQTYINHVYSLVDGYLCCFIKNPILTVHDLDNLENLKFVSKIILFVISVYIPSLFVKQYHCISNYTRKRLLKYIPWRSKSVNVIHNPVNPQFNRMFGAQSYNSSKLRILQIGTGRRKNLETLIESAKSIDDIKIELDIVGILSSDQEKLLESGNVNYNNYVDIKLEELILLYNQTHIVSFPSHAEGFGMIVVEANACEVPIIAGNIEVLREVGADAAIYINPKNSQEMKKAIIELYNNQTLRHKLIEKGKQNAKRFDIRKIAKEYMNLYKNN